MDNRNLVVDTNIFIDHFRARDKNSTVLSSVPVGTSIFLSAVTAYELYMGATTNEKKRELEILIGGFPILPFDHSFAIEAAIIYHDLRKSNKLIEFRDIFIAATCIAHDYPIKTINTKHFSRIKGLKLS